MGYEEQHFSTTSLSMQSSSQVDETIIPGTLADAGVHNRSCCMAFLHVVGVVYMKKHRSGSTITPFAYSMQFDKHH